MELLAAGEDCRQHRPGVRRDEDDERVSGRLFQRFQEGITGCRVEPVGGVDDARLPGRFKGAQRQFPLELPDLVNLDEVAVGFDQMEIRMLEFCDPATGRADAASFRAAAKQRFDKGDGGFVFAASFDPFEEIGVGGSTRCQRTPEHGETGLLSQYVTIGH